MYLLIKLLAYDRSGREQTIAYIKEPTTLDYGTFDMYLTSSSELGHCKDDNLKCRAVGVLTDLASCM